MRRPGRGRWRRAGARRRRARRAGARDGGRVGRAPAGRGRACRSPARPRPLRCSGRATFSRQVSVGSRLKNWKMKPILSRRRRVRSSSESAATDWPSMRISPEVGRSRPPIRLRSVDLPEPEGPDDGDHLAARDLEVDGIEGYDLALAVEVFGDAGEGNHRANSMIACGGRKPPAAPLLSLSLCSARNCANAAWWARAGPASQRTSKRSRKWNS